MAVVAPAGSRGDDGPGLPRGVIRAVFCRERGKLRAGGAGTQGPPPPHTPHTSRRRRHSPVPRPRSTCCCLQQGVTGVGWEPAPDSPAPAGTNARKSRGTGSAPGARPGKLPSEGKTSGWEEGEREEKPRERGKLTLAKGIDFKPGHFLGQDGFWQVEEGRIVDWEIVVIVLQDPDGRSLDAAGARGHKKQVSIHRGHAHGQDRTGREHGGLTAGTRMAPPVPGCSGTQRAHTRVQMHKHEYTRTNADAHMETQKRVFVHINTRVQTTHVCKHTKHTRERTSTTTAPRSCKHRSPHRHWSSPRPAGVPPNPSLSLSPLFT